MHIMDLNIDKQLQSLPKPNILNIFYNYIASCVGFKYKIKAFLKNKYMFDFVAVSFSLFV